MSNEPFYHAIFVPSQHALLTHHANIRLPHQLMQQCTNDRENDRELIRQWAIENKYLTHNSKIYELN